MARCTVPDADEILDKEFSLLDKGFVRLVDYMGSDDRIVQAARVSYGKGTKTIRKDTGLIDYLLRNGHTSPFEQIVFTFHAKMPIFVARQWIRHRTARVNEISARYSEMPNEFYIPEISHVAEQSSTNKQGRKPEAMEPVKAEKVCERIASAYKSTYSDYAALLENDTARELARIVLPQGLYTEMYWQIDLHNLFHFLRLRMDSHAQEEIRIYAEKIKELAAKVCPVAFASFERHILGELKFSKTECEALKRKLSGQDHGLKGHNATQFEAKLQNL